MKISRYYPASYDGFNPPTDEFTTKEELLALPWMKARSDDHLFHQFSLSFQSGNILMAEYRGGAEWWVAGYHEGIPEDWFPKWECPADKPKRKII